MVEERSQLVGVLERAEEHDPLVSIESLGKRYATFAALADCSLQIRAGEIYGLLGPNGAGKTTLMRCLLGFIRPTHGQALIAGFDCWSQRTMTHGLLTYMPAQPQLPRLLRARDVLRFFAEVRPELSPDFVASLPQSLPVFQSNAAERLKQARDLAERLDLDLSRWVALMSTGMRQKLAIAATLCANVPLVFLDEPTANLDPDVRSQLLYELQQLRAAGTTIIFSSHVLSEIEQVCDRVAVLARGHVVGVSEIRQLRQGSLIRGQRAREVAGWSLPEEIKWMGPTEFEFQTYRPLEEVLPTLLDAGVTGLRIQTLGLQDVYRQHLAYESPEKSKS